MIKSIIKNIIHNIDTHFNMYLKINRNATFEDIFKKELKIVLTNENYSKDYINVIVDYTCNRYDNRLNNNLDTHKKRKFTDITNIKHDNKKIKLLHC